MAVSIKERLKELGIVLPQTSRPNGFYTPAAALGYLLFTAGRVSRANDIVKYKGKAGGDSIPEDVYTGVRICVVSRLAAVEQAVGSLDHVAWTLKVNGYINAVPGFTQNPKVLDGTFDLLLEMFGNVGQCARSATGVQVLPGNAVVEVEMTVLLKGPCEYPAV